MLKNYIYLTIIPFILISCSKPTIIGDWKVSEKTLLDGIDNSAEMSYYYDLELKEKLASQISRNTTYSFLENGTLEVNILSTADTNNHTLLSNWKILDSNILEVTNPNDVSKYKIEIYENLLSLQNLADTTIKVVLEKK